MLRLMPSGPKMRCCTNSAQLSPLAACTTSPAAMNMRLEYSYLVRKGAAGSSWAARSSTSRAEYPVPHHSRSPLKVPRPLRWQSRSRTRSSAVAQGSLSLSQGR
jgi:hypothetical protein